MKNLIRVWLFSAGIFLTSAGYAQDVDSYNTQAYKAYQDKDYNLSITYCSQSIALKPNGWAYWQRASAKYVLKDYTGARDDYNLALPYYLPASDNSIIGNIYFYRGSCYLKSNNNSEALSDFTNALTYGYEKKYIYWNYGVIYARQKNYTKSIEYYDQAISLTADNKDLTVLYENRAVDNSALWKMKEAFEDYNKSIEKDSYHTSAYDGRAEVRSWLLDYKGAAEDMNKAIEYYEKGYTSDNSNSKPELYKMYANRGYYYYNTSQYSNALNDLDKSISLNPAYNIAYEDKAMVQEAMKNYPGANDTYAAAILMENDLKNKAALYRKKAELEQKMLDYPAAVADCDLSLKANPGNNYTYWLMAILHSRAKNFRESLRYYDKAATLYQAVSPAFSFDSANNAAILRQAARIRSTANDHAGALSDLQVALQYDTTDIYTYYELGRLYKEKIKDNTLAKENLDKVIRLAGQKDMGDMQAYAKVISGKREEAISDMTRVLEKYRADKAEYPSQLYNMACVQALAGDTQKGIAYLDQALAAGFVNFDHMQNDNDLDILRKLPAFKVLLVKYKVPAVK